MRRQDIESFVISLSGNTATTSSGRTITRRCLTSFLKKFNLSLPAGTKGSHIRVYYKATEPHISVVTPRKNLLREQTRVCRQVLNLNLEHPRGSLPSVMPAYAWRWNAIVIHAIANYSGKEAIATVLSDLMETYILSMNTVSESCAKSSVFQSPMKVESEPTKTTSITTT